MTLPSAALIGIVVAVLTLGIAVGWWAARARTVRAPVSQGGPSETPEPVLDWVLRAAGARGLWLRAEPGVAPMSHAREPIPEVIDLQVSARVQSLADGERNEDRVERLEEGTLVIAARPPAAVGMLFAESAPAGSARQDLHELLLFLQSRPVLEAVARQQERPGESLESIATRLAHQIECLVDADVVVAVRRPRGVEVVGASLRSDPRWVRIRVVAGTAVDRVARGEELGPLLTYDPLGVLAADRRRHTRAVVYPLLAWEAPVGAVALWPVDGAEPAGPRLAQLTQALDRAAPRIAGALEATEHREQATHDPLTGLPNRRGFDEVTGDVGTTSAALIAMDIDRFKALNDTLGHAAGDAALIHCASLLAQHTRGRDIAGRLGGEEFAIWLPGSSLERGIRVAERLRAALASSSWHWQGRPWPVTASFGVAAWPETTRSRENLAQQADRALYQAKEGGRNRVEGTRETG